MHSQLPGTLHAASVTIALIRKTVKLFGHQKAIGGGTGKALCGRVKHEGSIDVARPVDVTCKMEEWDGR